MSSQTEEENEGGTSNSTENQYTGRNFILYIAALPMPTAMHNI